MTTTIFELLHEIDVTPGLEKSIRSRAKTGMCSLSPPIFGAMVRMGAFGGGEVKGAKLAAEWVSVIDMYRAELHLVQEEVVDG